MTTLATITLTENSYKITASDNANDYMSSKHLDALLIISAILSLGKDKLDELKEKQNDTIVIDATTNVSVVLSCTNDEITILSIIPNDNIF